MSKPTFKDPCLVNEDDDFINCGRQHSHITNGELMLRNDDEQLMWIQIKEAKDFIAKNPQWEVYLATIDRMVHGECMEKNPEFFKESEENLTKYADHILNDELFEIERRLLDSYIDGNPDDPEVQKWQRYSDEVAKRDEKK